MADNSGSSSGAKSKNSGGVVIPAFDWDAAANAGIASAGAAAAATALNMGLQAGVSSRSPAAMSGEYRSYLSKYGAAATSAPASINPTLLSNNSGIFSDANIGALKYAAGMISNPMAPNDINEQSHYINFNRFYEVFPHIEMQDIRPYAFIVRPDLNIAVGNTEEASASARRDPFLLDMVKYHLNMMRSLTSKSTTEHDFIPFLVGRTESIQIPDYQLQTFAIGQPYTNYTQPYGGSVIESQTGGVFEMTFREDRYLRVHKLFQAWIYYIDAVKRNLLSPYDRWITFNKMDYACDVYYLVCDVSASKLLWWAKYTGCIPTSVPNSTLSFNRGGTSDNIVSIPFSYFWFESLNPEIIVDFNWNCGYRSTHSTPSWAQSVPDYNETMARSAPGTVGPPFIVPRSDGYYLRWRAAAARQFV